MAKRFPSQDSIVLDQVKVIFDNKTSSVKIVCEDGELPTGFALGVQKGGKLEKDLLGLLTKYGIVAEEVEKETPLPVEQELDHPEMFATVNTAPNYSNGDYNSNYDLPEGTKPDDVVHTDPTNANIETSTSTPVDKTTIPPGLHLPNVLPANPNSPTVIEPVGVIPQIRPDQLGNLISVLSPKERTGKTVTSVMLAGSLIRNPKIHELDNPHKVVVVDYDFKNKQATDISSAKSGGMLQIYETGRISKETILESLHYNEKLGIHLLPVGEMFPNPEDYLGADFLEKLIAELKNIFTVIIIDSNTQDVTYTHKWLVDNSDIILITSGVSRGTEFEVRTWLKGHVKLQRTVKKLSVLLTSTPKLQIMASFDDVKKIFQPLSIVGNIPADSGAFLTAIKNGTLDNSFVNHNAVADAYRAVASRLLGAAT